MNYNKCTEQNIIETIEYNYMPYAMSVIVSRAIPEIDGFKPSHRKLLYTMYKMGLINGAKTKSANVVGQTMKLNPHGDMAIYETLVRLTRGYAAKLHPYIDSKGNFGKQYSRDMKYAASRYTEVKLDKVCEEIFKDIDKDTVDFMNNYDGSTKEPVLLPTTFPNILVNSNQGIAVGMASNICSFNLKEVCATTIELIKNENVEITNHLLAPDLSTGGSLIYIKKDIENIYSTGRGSFKIRSKYKFDKANSCIDIYEIPYSTTAEAIIDDIIKLVKNGKIKEITDVRDETDLKGLKITVDIKKSADHKNIINKLYKLTPLQSSFNCNFNLLINSKPRVLGIKEILSEWIDFRLMSIKRQTLYDIKKKSDRLHLLSGLKKILLDIDKAIKIIRETEEESKVIPNLEEGFGIDEIQAEFIAEIKLRNLNKEYILKKVNEVDSLNKEIEDLKDLYQNDKKIKKLICKQLKDVSKKYGVDRKTEIIQEENVEVITEEHLIENYNLKLFLTKDNYLKKIPLTSLRSNPEQKLKEEDELIQEVETSNKGDLILFSNKKVAYKCKIYEILDCKASSLGEYLKNMLELAEGEEIIYMVGTEEYSGNLLFVFENGKVAKVPLKSYETKTNRKKLANAYSEASRLVYIDLIEEDKELVAFTSLKKVLIFNTERINAKSTRDTLGVQVVKGKKGSYLVSVKELEEVSFTDFDYYRTKNIPAVGCYLKEEDVQEFP